MDIEQFNELGRAYRSAAEQMAEVRDAQIRLTEATAVAEDAFTAARKALYAFAAQAALDG